MTPPIAVRGAVPALLLLSGFAGLGYQIVWIRLLTVGLGAEAVAMLAVVAAFFVGLAVGAAAFDRRIARSARPGAWYAALEVLIGLWALALIPLAPVANDWFAALIGPDPSDPWRWAVCFGGPLLLLAPATVAMGATLPAAERLHARLTGETRSVGAIYAANAAGAAVGAVATLLLLGPAVGFEGSLAVFAAANLLCAALALAGPARGEARRAEPAEPPARPGAAVAAAPAALLFATGLLGVGVEVALVRALAQTLENTVYSFAWVIAIYLLGATTGAAWLQARARGSAAEPVSPPALLWALGAATLWAAAGATVSGDAYDALRGEGAARAMAVEAGAVAALFLPAATVMGALFALLAQRSRRPDGGLGAALAVNTLGAAAAPLAVGVVLVPALGAVGALGALAAAYGALAALTAPVAPVWRRAAAAAGSAAVCVAVLAPLDRTLVRSEPGETVEALRHGASSTAAVLRGSDGLRRLVVDGRFAMGGDPTEPMDRLQGHLALLLHPEPRRALFLGLGAGYTFAAARAHPALSAEAVELSAPVLATLDAFAGAALDIAAEGDRLRLHVADARRWVRAVDAEYDVIVADTFHPARDGAGLLYTVEHFAAARARLAPGGVFAQWLPLHQIDLPALQVIARSFLAVYPDATLHMANASLTTPLLMLVGRNGAAAPDLATLTHRARSPALRAALTGLGVDSPFAALGGFIAGPQALTAWAGEGPLNTDAFPRILFAAPASVYAPLGPAADRLIALIDSMEAVPADALTITPARRDADFAARLADYWRARDAFIRLGAGAAVSGDPVADALALAPPLLDVLRISPDYAPARRPLLALARALDAVDPEGARVLRDAVAQARVASAASPAPTSAP
jgi:spermidine synthase